MPERAKGQRERPLQVSLQLSIFAPTNQTKPNQTNEAIFQPTGVATAGNHFCGDFVLEERRESPWGGAAELSLTIDPAELIFDQVGSEKQFTITNNSDWSITKTESWVTLSRSTGNGNAQITVTTAANDTPDERTATLTIKVGDKTKTLTVTQAAYSIYGDIPTVHVAQAGTLEAILTEKGLLGTTALKITGVLNDNDIDTFKSMITSTLRTLDISGADVPNTFDLEGSQIEKIALPNAWTAIPNNFLRESEDLTSVVIGDNVEKIRGYTFGYCSSLASINIPEGVTSIGDYAFTDCDGLTSITIPESVTSIGEAAFYLCSSLASITIPEGVTSIGAAAFSACTSLASITIPEGVTSIENSAFSGCTNLASITIPEGVTSIDRYAFVVCKSLKNINIAAGNAQYMSENGVIFSKDKSQLICFPAVNGSYTIPEGVTSIRATAFYNCISLASIIIPAGVTSIGEHTFVFCTSLASITIPDGVTSIGEYTFAYCQSLESITIPEGVTSIGESTFMGCTSLANVTCLAAIPPAIGDSNFSNFSTDVLHVPSESVEAYKADAAWSACFSSIVAIAE